jgi:hypothetical protein
MPGDPHQHPTRPVPPGLIRHLVHVAVVTCEIARTMHLDDELTEGNWNKPTGPMTRPVTSGYAKGVARKPGFRWQKCVTSEWV